MRDQADKKPGGKPARKPTNTGTKRDGGKPASRPARPKRDDSKPAGRPSRPARPSRDDAKPAGRPSRPARPSRDDSKPAGRPARPSRPPRDDAKPAGRPSRPARPSRDDAKPAGRPSRPARPSRDDAKPAGRPGRPGRPSRPASPGVDEKVRRPQKGSRSNAKTRTPEALQLEVPQELRLSRFLSMAGVASRRAAEQLILDGKVKVNGYVVKTLGTKINPKSDRVEVEGKPASADRALVVILLNKPKGCICSRKDPEGRESVYDILGAAGKGLFSIGRLDYNSEGVILFTNDGNLAQALMHPSASVKRVYRVRIRGLVDPQLGRRLLEGVESEGEMLSVEEAWVDGQTKTHTWVSVVLREGKNRHLRRMFEALGYTVARLVRVQYAALDTGDLDPGRWRQLSPGELKGITALAAAANQAPASH